LSVSERSSTAIADLVICAAIKHNLTIYESMERAVAQYEAVGGDHLALRRTFIKLVADTVDRTPAQTPHIKPEEKFESAERRRSGRKKRGPRKSVNLGGNPGNWQMLKGMWRLTLTNIRTTFGHYCKGLLEEELGRDMGGPCPISSLREISKMWDHFSIPGEAVMVAPKYEHLDLDKA
jgi:hypothetical protein